MAIIQSVCTSFKAELLEGLHNFTSDTFKVALYTSDATLKATTTAYTTTEEITGTGYSAGGATLSPVTPTTSNGVGILDFADVSWASATFTARGALVYNSTNGDRAVMVLDFGADKVATSQTFTIQFPTADSVSAILRVA